MLVGNPMLFNRSPWGRRFKPHIVCVGRKLRPLDVRRRTEQPHGNGPAWQVRQCELPVACRLCSPRSGCAHACVRTGAIAELCAFLYPDRSKCGAKVCCAVSLAEGGIIRHSR